MSRCISPFRCAQIGFLEGKYRVNIVTNVYKGDLQKMKNRCKNVPRTSKNVYAGKMLKKCDGKNVMHGLSKKCEKEIISMCRECAGDVQKMST